MVGVLPLKPVAFSRKTKKVKKKQCKWCYAHYVITPTELDRKLATIQP